METTLRLPLGLISRPWIGKLMASGKNELSFPKTKIFMQ